MHMHVYTVGIFLIDKCCDVFPVYSFSWKHAESAGPVSPLARRPLYLPFPLYLYLPFLSLCLFLPRYSFFVFLPTSVPVVDVSRGAGSVFSRGEHCSEGAVLGELSTPHHTEQVRSTSRYCCYCYCC